MAMIHISIIEGERVSYITYLFDPFTIIITKLDIWIIKKLTKLAISAIIGYRNIVKLKIEYHWCKN